MKTQIKHSVNVKWTILNLLGQITNLLLELNILIEDITSIPIKFKTSNSLPSQPYKFKIHL